MYQVRQKRSQTMYKDWLISCSKMHHIKHQLQLFVLHTERTKWRPQGVVTSKHRKKLNQGGHNFYTPCFVVTCRIFRYVQVIRFLSPQAHKSIQLKQIKAHSMQFIGEYWNIVVIFFRMLQWTKHQIFGVIAEQIECLSPKGSTSNLATSVLAWLTTSPAVFLWDNIKITE